MSLLTWSLLQKSWIAKVVLSEAALLAVGILCTVFLLTFRQAWRKYQLSRKTLFSERLIGLLFEPNPQKVTVWPWDREIYREILLSQMQALSGQERDLLTAHYMDMGFLKEDESQTFSRSWSKRLIALIRLDQLSKPESRNVFVRCLKDTHPLVALSSIRALSKMGTQSSNLIFDPQILLKSLEKVGLERRTALYEVISNLGSSYGPEVICDYLNQCENSEMAVACVHVLGDLRAVQAMPIFLQVLQTPSSVSELILVKVLDAIPLIADPEAIEPIRNLLTHPSSSVRARAVIALDFFGDETFLAQLDQIRNQDSDVEVQRALKFIQKKAG